MGEEGLTSPRSRVKFLCSHGGKILPRPSDGQLKYVGGETRVVAAPRTISFSELKKKLSSLLEGDMVLKYQMMREDLDALVSVTCDEDLKHMIDEYDRQGSSGSPRLRAFLFPSSPFLLNTNDPNAIEQRYIDAINGIVRTTSNVNASSAGSSPKSMASVRTTSNVNAARPIFSISSGGSSPKSSAPDAFHMNQDNVLCDGIGNPSRTFSVDHNFRMQDMQRVHSSPSLLSLGHQHQHHQHPHQYYYNQQARVVPPRLPISPRIAMPSDGHSRCYQPVGHHGVSIPCLGCCGHVDGWKSYRSGMFADSDNIPQFSMKRMGAESFNK